MFGGLDQVGSRKSGATVLQRRVFLTRNIVVVVDNGSVVVDFDAVVADITRSTEVTRNSRRPLFIFPVKKSYWKILKMEEKAKGGREGKKGNERRGRERKRERERLKRK